MELKTSDDKLSIDACSVYLSARGVFEITKLDVDEEDRNAIMHNIAPSVLYGSAREFLVGITSRGPFGAIMFPLVSFPESGPESGNALSGRGKGEIGAAVERPKSKRWRKASGK